jgi:hypothetical protein
MGDAALMDKFCISARGLESLYRKLVLAGAVTQNEIDRRAVTFDRSHVVELTSFGPPSAEKATISSGDAVQAIRLGLTDAELMSRYGISPSGLESLFSKLVKSRKITREELERRARSLAWSDQAFVPGNEANAGIWEPPHLEARTRGAFTQLFWEYKTYFAAGFTTAVAIMGAVALTLFFTGVIPYWARATKQPATPAMKEILALQDQAEDTISTLEDIIRISVRPGPYEGPSVAYRDPAATQEKIDSISYKSCMDECERSFSGKTEEDRLLLVNCKMRCMSQYNLRIKKLRERFYSRPLK